MMVMMMPRIAALLMLMASAGAAAASDGLPDGRWSVKLTGQGPNPLCRGSIGTVGEVRDGKPVYAGQAVYSLKVTPSGVLVAQGSRRDDRASAQGLIRGDVARGTFTIPTRNCAGTWEALKVGA